ncbi:MAG: hypothetical protein JWM95_85 [Gemmatimonadetes bacterium]|nr:hypothetical protein [Gemmatimonadota bacterium]
MKIALMVLGVIVAVVVIVVVVGYGLPVKHHASRQAVFRSPAESVYAAIANVRDYPTWRSKVQSVEVLSEQSFREKGSDGAILYVVESAAPPVRRVTRIADDKLPFGGTWTYELTPTSGGTALRITEDGEVYNPVFRFMSKFVFGHRATIDGYLKDLGKKFGSTVEITD